MTETDVTDIGLAKLQLGQLEVESGLAVSDGFSLPGVAEAKARAGLATLRSAMNWLEDGPHFEEAHRALDAAGRQVRERFGCRIRYQPGKGYEQTCPVALAHNRLGMSVGILVRARECSICGRDPEECHHVNGREYDGERCHSTITDAEILEVSLVARPRLPDARIMSYSLDRKDLEEQLGPEFVYGDDFSCDRCLMTCPGVVDPATAGSP